MATTNNSATNNVPIFGLPGTVKVYTGGSESSVGTAGTAKTWILTGITVSPSEDIAELRDSNGMVVSRTNYNQDSSGNNKNTTLTINAVPVGADAAAALTAGGILKGGTVIKVESSTVPGANGDWHVRSFSASGTNTDHVTITINASWAVTNS